MSGARALESWEHDDAHQALDQWMWAWRQHHTTSSEKPPLTFLRHLGEDAVALQVGGTPKVELARLFWASAEDGTCPCGHRWDTPPPAPENGEAA